MDGGSCECFLNEMRCGIGLSSLLNFDPDGGSYVAVRSEKIYYLDS